MLPPEIYAVSEKLGDSRARVRFTDGAEHLLAIYSFSHVRLNDIFLADIVGKGSQAASYQWAIEDGARIKDETGRLLCEKNTAKLPPATFFHATFYLLVDQFRRNL